MFALADCVTSGLKVCLLSGLASALIACGGGGGSSGAGGGGSTDTTPPVFIEVTPVTTPTTDATPSYTFQSNEAGGLTYSGSCTSTATLAVAGNNTITFSTLPAGTYSNCEIHVTDSAGNVTTFTVSSFTITEADTTSPLLATVIAVATPTNDTTPDFTFSSTEAGTIIYGGSCSSVTTVASSGNNTVTFNTLAVGTYSNCTVKVTDAASNQSLVLAVPSFTITPVPVVDTTAPILSIVSAVPTPGNDTTPSFTFLSNEVGTITYGGSCSSATTVASSGNNIITLNALAAGTYSNCTVKVTDAANNASTNLAIASFTIDTTVPTLAVVTAIPTQANDTTPNFTFSSSEAGTITYGGSCTSATTVANSGNNTITLNALAAGIYSNCTVKVTDAAGNASANLAIASFTIDTTVPTLVVVTAVPTPASDTTPNFTFSTSEAGTITYGGSCSSASTAASSGNNTITLNALVAGTYNNCTVKVTDAAGNASANLAITSFTIDTSLPTLTVVAPVGTPSNDITPNFTFSSSEAGTITYGGSCSSATTAAANGNNTITLNALAAGTYSNCTVKVTDAAGNTSAILAIASFTITIDNTLPTLTVVTPVVTPSNDTTPNFTFSSTEAGTITYGGSCSSATTVASSGNNIITLNALAAGTYSNCTVKVTDAAGNTSAILAIASFTIQAAPTHPINDTGITLCGDHAYPDATHNNNIDCLNSASPSATKTSQGTEIGYGFDPMPAGQDAHFGRDANPSTNSDIDGWKGFSYTKLKADGTALVNQTQAWGFNGSGFDNGTEAGGTNWSCVKDNVTGLIWEVKTNKPTADYRDKDAIYHWYSSDGSNNGGNAGIEDSGAGSTCFNTGKCDTQKYVAYVNTQNLCGVNTDWRMPTPEELKTLRKLNAVKPTIDVAFMPNTVNDYYWSSSSHMGGLGMSWVVNFSDGQEYAGGKVTGTYYVRLVRGGQLL